MPDDDSLEGIEGCKMFTLKSRTTRIILLVLIAGFLQHPLQAQGFSETGDFILADLQTGSTGFTNSNVVDLVTFPIPDGYDVFQFTGRDGDIVALDPQSWTDDVPATLSFTATGSADEILLYAWFTNTTDQVSLLRAEGKIVYTTIEPNPAAIPSLTRETDGFTVRIEGWQIDGGSTGGSALGREMKVHALEARFLGGDFPNLTPDAAYLTLTNQPAVYSLGLRVMNEAGNIAEAAIPCTVMITAMETPPAGDRFVAVGNLHARHPYDSWDKAAASVQQAVDAVGDGERILIAPGRYTAEAGDQVIDMDTFNKSVEFIGLGGSSAVRIDGEGLRRTMLIKHTKAGVFDTHIEGLAFVNGVTASMGGGVYIVYVINQAAAGTVTLTDCEITDNCVTAANGSYAGGGGLYWDARSTGQTALVLRRCTIARNAVFKHPDYARGYGGGAYFRDGDVLVEDCRILSNQAAYDGGGLYFQQVTNAIVRSCEISGNNGRGAAKSGRSGAFNASGAGCKLLVENSTICKNHAQDRGGVSSMNPGASVTIRNSLMLGNVGERSGAFNIEQSTVCSLVLENCTIVGNQAWPQTGSGGLRLLGSSSFITNCIIYSNYNYDGAVVNFNGSPSSLAHTCTTGTAFPPGAGNIDTPPDFTDPGQGYGESFVPGDYRLAPGSPCINAGVNAAWMESTTDLYENRRIDRFSGIVDMGAHEYQPVGSILLVH